MGGRPSEPLIDDLRAAKVTILSRGKNAEALLA
jgi:hypothetical protein